MTEDTERETPMWDALIKRWLDLLFWWAPKKPGGAPDRTTATARRAQQAPRAPAEPGTRAAPRQATHRPAQPTTARAPSASRPSARAASRSAAAPAAEAPKRSAPKATAAEPAAPEPEKAVTAPVPDDLTVIKGIGPALQNRLRALGITTFADLAAANPDKLMAQLKGAQPLSRARVQHWTEVARERVRN
jgi:predicted flap endonuclease-1-like 5' DNA nuclease